MPEFVTTAGGHLVYFWYFVDRLNIQELTCHRTTESVQRVNGSEMSKLEVKKKKKHTHSQNVRVKFLVEAGCAPLHPATVDMRGFGGGGGVHLIGEPGVERGKAEGGGVVTTMYVVACCTSHTWGSHTLTFVYFFFQQQER